jgi:hypothetical protein
MAATSPTTVREPSVFCAAGAIARAMHDLPCHRAYAPFRALEAAGSTEAIPLWNDRLKSKRPVLARFDKAIAMLEGRHG